jgi:hypothetical protein
LDYLKKFTFFKNNYQVTSNIFLCSFASPDLFISKRRFLKQAKSMNFYKSIKVYSFDDLLENTKKKINEYLLLKERRGYGFWIWKPEIILDALINIPDGSILQYSDLGCHINAAGLQRLKEYQNICTQKNMITFQYYEPKNKKKDLIYPDYLEYKYTKSDLMNFFNLNDKSIHMNSPQIISGSLFIKKNKENIEFIKNWLKIFDNMSLIDNSSSVMKNHVEFIEHRHDQSALSLLCKLNNIFSLSAYDHCEWALDKKGRNWIHLTDSPVQARRDLKYISFYALKKNMNKIFNRIKK